MRAPGLPPTLVALAIVHASSLSAPSAAAQTSDLLADKMKEKVLGEGPADEEGWKGKAKVGATFSLNHNDNVVGTEDGLTLQLGLVLSADVDYTDGPHSWENELSIQETQTRTPQLERFVKSLDQLDFVTTYNYRFEDIGWLGVFAKALINTQIFDGELVATEPTEVRRPGTGTESIAETVPYDGQARLFLEQGDAVGLTGAFEPLNLRQSIGAFAEPYREPEFHLSLKLGVGAQEILTRGNDVLVGTFDENGRVAVVRELENTVVELGLEAQADVRGEVIEKILSYYLTINGFYPPITTSEVDRSFADSINLRLKAGASLKLTEVVSIDYVLTVLRIPATTEDFQIQNGLLISAGFDLL